MVLGEQNKLVSVIMPVKKCYSGYLERSIESVLKQTYANLELLVVVDASNLFMEERLLNVLTKFKDDKRLRLIHNKKKGFVEALNTGIMKAKGEYIARMDGDDICLPDRLKIQVNALEKENVDTRRGDYGDLYFENTKAGNRPASKEITNGSKKNK